MVGVRNVSETQDFTIQNIELLFSGRQRQTMGQVKQTETAVLVPLVYDAHGHLCVLFEERAHTLRRQPGEISFPGGHVEASDINFAFTAQRETSEELGIPLHDVHIIGELDILLAWSGLVVYPYVGWLQNCNDMVPNPSEVDHVFLVPLMDLLSTVPERFDVGLKPDIPENYPYHLIPSGRNYPWRESVVTHTFYKLQNHVVWGLTARILAHFLDVIERTKESTTK